MKFLTILFLLFVAAFCSAQEVRDRSSGYGSLRRLGETEAAKAGVTDWPLVNDNGRGTQVHVSFDFKDADITILACPPLPRDKMLALGRRIASRLDLPRSDFILPPSKTYSSIDVEMNKHLVLEGNRHSFSLDLGQLAQALESSPDLPSPVLVRVEGSDADTATVDTKPVGKSLFLHLSDLKPGTIVHFSASVDWRAYFGASIMCGLLLLAMTMVVLMPWRLEKSRQKRLRSKEHEDGVPDPDEVQKRYDRTKPQWLLSLAIAAPAMIMLFGLKSFDAYLKLATRVLPHMPDDPRWSLLGPMLVMLSIFGVNSLAIRTYRQRLARRDPALAIVKPADDELGAFKALPWMFLPLLLMPMLLFIPGFSTLSPVVRRVLIFGTIALGFAVFLFVAVKANRKRRTTLSPGDPIYDATQQFADEAGVRVRSVHLVASKRCNAFVDLLGRVSLTRGLVEKCDPEEVRAVIAHEIGHMKARHLSRIFPLSLVVSLGIVATYLYLVEHYRDRMSPALYTLLDSMLIPLFVLPMLSSLVLGKMRRRHEREADAFAVQATGDPELVIRALSKIHTLNATPHTLKKSDELLSAHPSLTNRIAHIREVAGSIPER